VLAVIRKENQIVAVGAIKSIRPSYARKHAALSGYPFPSQTPELGYVSRHRNHAGHRFAPKIVATLLLLHDGPLWATTDSDGMKTALRQYDFTQKGKEWPGGRGQLSLWLRSQ
jgi:hypothetical protein